MKYLCTIFLTLCVSTGFSQEIQYDSLKDYFSFIANNPYVDTGTVYKHLNYVDEDIRSFDKALRSYDLEQVRALLEQEKVSVTTTVFLEDERSPFHILGLHSMNKSSENISARINQHKLAAYALYMTTPLVLMASLNPENEIEQDAQIAMIRTLLEYSESSIVDESDWFGRLPIIVAAENRNLKVLEVLLELGANPNLQVTLQTPAMDDLFYNMDADGALHKCLYGKVGLGKAYIPKDRDTEIAKACMTVLLNYEVNVDQKNIYHETPLHASACAGEDELVALLIEYGSDSTLLAMSPGFDGANWANDTGAPRRVVPKASEDNSVYSVEDYASYGRKNFRDQYKKQVGKENVPFCFIKKPDQIKEHYKSYRTIRRMLKETEN